MYIPQFQRMRLCHSMYLNMDRVKLQILKRYKQFQKLLSRNLYVLIVMMESENRYSKYIGKINLNLYFYTNLPNGIPNFCSYQLLCNYCHYWLHDFFSNNDPLEKKRLIYKNQNYSFSWKQLTWSREYS